MGFNNHISLGGNCSKDYTPQTKTITTAEYSDLQNKEKYIQQLIKIPEFKEWVFNQLENTKQCYENNEKNDTLCMFRMWIKRNEENN